jgi:uncharacterized protein (DUF2147 family)
VRDRVQFIAGSLLASLLSDPAAARGQAIGMFSQTLAQRVVAGGYTNALIALVAVLVVVLGGALLFKASQRQPGQWPAWGALRAGSLALEAPSRSRRSGFAAMAGLAGRHAPFAIAATLAIGLAASSASAASEDGPLGTWFTANGHGVVAIDRCGDALCGRIVGIDRKPTEPMPVDVDGRPQCGLTIITNQRPQPDGTWLGQVIDPRDGGVYRGKLWLDGRGNLRLRGFIGIPALGATQTWHRFNGHLTAACGLA